MLNNEPTIEQLIGLVDITECEAQAEKETREIFGRRQSLSADESAIAWNRRLTHQEKVEQITALRKAKAVKRERRRAARLSGTAAA